MSYKSNIPPTGRDFFFSQGASDDIQSGLSDETPVSTPFAAATLAANVSPPPSDNDPVSINGLSGTYIGALTIPQNANFNGATVALINFSPVPTIECLGRQRIEVGAAINTASNGVCVKIDGQERVGIRPSTVVVGGDDGIGFDVTGTCDDIFIEVLSGTISGERAIMFKHTATSETPFEYRGSVVEVFNDDQVFMDFDPSSASDQAIVKFATVQDGNGAINSTLFIARGGRLSIDCNILQGDCFLRVNDGGQATVDCDLAIGDLIVETGGSAIAKSIGLMSGNIVVESEAILEIICNDYTGVITNNGTINGIINGVPFGRYRQKPFEDILLDAFSTSDQLPAGLDMPLQIEFGAAQGSASDPVEIDMNGNILIHKGDQYKFVFFIQYGRTGSGGSSFLFFRLLVDGVQVGNSPFSKLDGSGDDLPIQITRTLNLTAGQVLTTEMVRDSAGNDSGGLFSETPTLGDWNVSPSASVVVSRELLVQAINLIAFLPGSSGDFFSTADSTASSITSDIDIRVRVSATDWTPSIAETIVSKWEDTGFEKTFIFQLSSTGALRIFLSEDGAVTLGPATSSVVNTFIDGTLHWVRFTWDEATGDVDFYVSDDNTDDSTLVNWTLLGVTQTLSPAGLFDSVSDVEVGSHNSGAAANFDGEVSRVSIFNGIGGTLAVDFNPQDYRGNSAFISSITGEVWFLNGNASITP